MPLCNPPKNPILFITVCLSNPSHGFYIFYLFFFLSCCPGQPFTETTTTKNSKPRNFSTSFIIFLPPHLSLLLLSLLFPSSLFPITHFLVSPTTCLSSLYNSHHLLSGSCVKASLSDLMKKMKGVVAPLDPSSYALFKHQSLMQDYQELQKDSVAMKIRLEMMKQKKSILSAEVRFLRRRYKYLIEKQSMTSKPKQDLVQTQNLKVQRNNVSKGRNYSKKESTLRNPAPAMDLNKRARINNAMGVALRKSTTPNSDRNHKTRTVSWKETSLPEPNPVIDLNQKEMTQIGKESVKQKKAPVFDLNQVSLGEEEENEANFEALRTDEPNNSILRGGIDEQHNDMKLLVCRTSGSGSNQSGKRKITWQDQVALRV